MCHKGYSVSYTDCYAFRNKRRSNYLCYMLVQEILFWISIIIYSEVTRKLSIDARHFNKPAMKLQWFVIIMSVSTVVTGLAIFILIIRLRGIYCKREIEDIVVYDRRYEQELDFDS